jgi:thioredoxin reductase (NADPH)
MRECLFLCRYSDRVCYMQHEGDADPALAAELRDCGVQQLGVPLRAASVNANGAVVLTFDDGQAREFDVVYAALGATARVELARALHARLDDKGGVIVDHHCATSVPGLYAAGDVVSSLDQLAVAIGHAAIAATAIHNRLRDTATSLHA